MKDFRAWMQQPTTVAGMSAMLGTFVAMLMHQVTWAHAIPLLAGAAMSAILPDNSGARQQAELLTGTMVAKFTSGGTSSSGLAGQTDPMAGSSH